MTSAPWSAMNCVISGPGRNSDRSTTRRPSSFTARFAPWSKCRLLLPGGFALFDEGADALAGILTHHVQGDRLAGDLVGVRERRFNLVVEQMLTLRDYYRGLRLDQLDQRRNFRIEALRPRHAIHQAPGKRGFRVDELAREQHLERPLARDIARYGNAGRGTEQPKVDAGGRELR